MSRRHAARPRLRLVVDNSSSFVSATPHSCALSNKSKCQSPGTLSRSRHLRLASPLTPSFSASELIRSQTSMQRVSDELSDLSRTTGPLILPENPPKYTMTKKEPPGVFNAAMCRRLKDARKAAGETQASFADKLGITMEAYRKNENRSPLPHYLIPRACRELGMDSWYFLTGQFRQPHDDQEAKEQTLSRQRRQSPVDSVRHDTRK